MGEKRESKFRVSGNLCQFWQKCMARSADAQRALGGARTNSVLVDNRLVGNSGG